ncbi:MAG: 23S rRNA (pseudouridine(1915)-N(3))-methyltransferase RlmH [Acidobacteriota bacterium]
MTGGLLVVWVGNRPVRALEELADDYQARISRLAPFTQVRVRPASGRGLDASRALAREAGRIREHLRPGDHLVVLDERGREQTTVSLAAWLAGALERARVALVVGSDLGLDEALRREAREALALSRLTLPHALARVLLLEQLYRALDLNAGGAYHRPDIRCAPR